MILIKLNEISSNVNDGEHLARDKISNKYA